MENLLPGSPLGLLAEFSFFWLLFEVPIQCWLSEGPLSVPLDSYLPSHVAPPSSKQAAAH